MYELHDITISELERRILKRIKKDSNGCWIWQGCYFSWGYPRIISVKEQYGVHRVMWALTHGKRIRRWRKGEHVINHICNNKKCVNPNHLEKVSQAINILKNPRKRTSHLAYCQENHNNIDIAYYRRKYKSGVAQIAKCKHCYNIYMRERYSRLQTPVRVLKL